MSGASSDARVEVGCSQRVFTPPFGLDMAGYATIRRAEAVLDDLYITAMAIRTADLTTVLVGVDVLALAGPSVAEIRMLVEEKIGMPPHNILIAASHTHTGPTTVEVFDSTPDATWMDVFHRQVASVAIEAYRNLESATLSVGHAETATMLFNRRTLDADGRAQMTLDQQADRSGLRVEGPIDPSVQVLSAQRADGSFIGIAVNYANHLDIPTGARYSADYPGVMRTSVAARLQGNPCVTFLNGACGNLEHIDPLDPHALDTRERYYDSAGPAKMAVLGEALADAVVEAVRDGQPLATPQQSAVHSVTLNLNVRTVDDALLDWAHRVVRTGDASNHERIFANETLLVHERRAGSIAVELTAIRLGGLAIVGIPAEVFVELGLELKERSPFAATMVVELANGWVGYLPTEQAFAAGGYEVRTARSSQLEPRAAHHIVEAASALLTQCQDTRATWRREA